MKSTSSHAFTLLACAALLHFVSVRSVADDFTIRQVTNFGTPLSGSRGTPLAVVNDQLLFLGIENAKVGLYRTDGTDIHLIDNSVMIPTDTLSLSSVETIQLGNELFFSAAGPDGRELYATDGQSIRQVANLAAGSLSSRPREFQIVNGNLLFTGITGDPNMPGGTPIRFFHTDGATIEEFPIASLPDESAALPGRLVFLGYPPGGGMSKSYSTDGTSITEIVSTTGQSLVGPQHFSRVGDNVYFVAGDFSDQGLYRTDGGATGNLVAKLSDFSFKNVVDSAFEFKESLYLRVNDSINNKMVIYRTDGGIPVEATTFQPPPGFFVTEFFPNESDPIVVSNQQAFFSFENFSGTSRKLYSFDGTALTPVDLGAEFNIFNASTFGDRVFLYAGKVLGPSPQLFELIGTNAVPLGIGLDSLTIFNGELFGVSMLIPDPFPPFKIYRTANGQLIELGNVADGRIEPTPFVEFNGQLYFNGIGQNSQLFAVMPVPEPSALMIAGLALVGIYWSRRSMTRSANHCGSAART